METRKLQEVGGGTYTVSIPKEWARKHALEAGNTVQLHTHGDDAIVVRSADADDGPLAATEIRVDGSDPEFVTRVLQRAYGIGFESVTLTPVSSFSTETRRAVRRTVREFVGTEIVAESDEELTVRNLLDASTVSVDQSIVKLQSIALSTHRSATTAVCEGGDTDARLGQRRDEALRVSDMVERHLARSLVSLSEVDRLGTSLHRLFDYYETARHLERVADEAVTMARLNEQADPLPDGATAELRRTADAARRLVDDATAAVLQESSPAVANEIRDRYDDVRGDVEAVEDALLDERNSFADLSRTTAMTAVRALDATGRTADHGAAIADVALRAGIRKTTD